MTLESPERKNIREILNIERESFGAPSRLDRFTSAVTAYAGGPLFVVFHVIWFGGWIVFNSRRGANFDPYPFTLLTLVVSLEAIFLTGFVLREQNRMSAQADRRAELDLQVNLLAEQELTAILRVLCAVGEKAGLDVDHCDPHVSQFRAQTDIRAIAAELDSERAASR